MRNTHITRNNTNLEPTAHNVQVDSKEFKNGMRSVHCKKSTYIKWIQEHNFATFDDDVHISVEVHFKTVKTVVKVSISSAKPLTLLISKGTHIPNKHEHVKNIDPCVQKSIQNTVSHLDKLSQRLWRGYFPKLELCLFHLFENFISSDGLVVKPFQPWHEVEKANGQREKL